MKQNRGFKVRKTRVYVAPFIPRDVESLGDLEDEVRNRGGEFLRELKSNCPNIEFVGGNIISNFGQLGEIEKREDIDGILIHFLFGWVPNRNLPWFFQERGLDISLFKRHPMIITCTQSEDEQSFFEFYDLVKKESLPVLPAHYSNFGDVVKAIRLFEVIHKMKESRILNIGESEALWDHSYSWRRQREKYLKILKETFGMDVITIGYEKLNEYFQEVSEESARKLAQKWMAEAIAVAEVREEAVINSAKMYFALKKAMKDVDADAVTVDCIPLFYEKERPIFAFPCMAYVQLNDEGSVGVCEADMDCAVTQLMMYHLTERSSFVADESFDISAGQIIYWHCVTPTKLFGKEGPSAPHILRSEHTGHGVGITVIAPPGEIATIVKIDVRDRKVAIHQGKCVGNSWRPGCRSQWAFETNVTKVLENHEHQKFGQHRVISFGDFRKEILDLATLLGLEPVEEDK